MKTKALIWFGLIFQFGFLLFILFQAPEPFSSIKIGLEQLQTNCPTQAAIGQKTPDGNWIINTAGDNFSMANKDFGFIIATTFIFTLVNVIISFSLLFSLRKKKED